MAAVLATGKTAALSHASAAELWGIRTQWRGNIEISTLGGARSRQGVTVHRRLKLAVVEHRGILVTPPLDTIVDLAKRPGLERMINEADKLDLIDIDELPPGLVGPDFTLTDSELERRFLPLAKRAGLPTPLTQQTVNGFRVDFRWPDLGLVVETDGLRYHRTPAQQTRDRLRDQAHTASGLAVLRFTYAQVTKDPEQVIATLSSAASLRTYRSGAWRPG